MWMEFKIILRRQHCWELPNMTSKVRWRGVSKIMTQKGRLLNEDRGCWEPKLILHASCLSSCSQLGLGMISDLSHQANPAKVLGWSYEKVKVVSYTSKQISYFSASTKGIFIVHLIRSSHLNTLAYRFRSRWVDCLVFTALKASLRKDYTLDWPNPTICALSCFGRGQDVLLWSIYHIFCPCFGHRRGTISQWPPDSGHLEIEPFEDVEERWRTIHEPGGGGRHTTGCSTQTPVSCDWLKPSAKYSPCIEVVWESGRKFLWGAFSRTKGPNFTPRDRRSMAGDVDVHAGVGWHRVTMYW